MKVKILYFAILRNKLGKNEDLISISEGLKIKDIKEILIYKYPEIKEILDKSMFAVNENYVDENYTLKDGDTIAIIPPVGGG